MIKDRTDVAIVKIADHENLRDAIQDGLELIQFKGELIAGKRVLLKPNCLQASENAITSPEVIGAVSKIMKDFGAVVDIGDSPMSGGITAEAIYKKIGKFDLINELGDNPNWISLMENPQLIERTYFKRLEKTVVSRNFLDASFVVNLPRYKTHLLTTFTGAIKNFWGIQAGTTKSKSHLYGRSPKNFGIVLTDLFNFIYEEKKSNLIIMDAIEIMHGSGGPSFGRMMDLGLILIGTDAVAVDTVCVKIAKNNIKKVHYLGECSERGLGISDINKINVLGTQIEDIKPPSRIIFPAGTSSGFFGLFQGLGNRFLKQYPFLNKNICKKCGDCSRLCPAQCITMDEVTGYPIFTRKDCINCLCCVEGCPQHALKPRRAGVLGALGLY